MTGRGVVVAGAAGGIGSAVARHFRAAGWVVVALDTDPRVAESADIGCVPVVGDASDEAVVRSAFDALGSTPPAALVHSILAEHRAPFADLRGVQVSRVIEVGAVSALTAIRELATRAAGPSSAVLVGSVHAGAAVPGQAAYAMAKAALEALSRAAAVEFGPVGLRCNVVRPGFVPVQRNSHRWDDPVERAALTAASPSARLCTPEEIADVIGFLADPKSIAVSGATLTVDGAVTSRLWDTR